MNAVVVEMAVHTPGPWRWEGYRMLRPVKLDPDQHYVHTILDAEDGQWTGTGFAIHDYRETHKRRDAEQAANFAILEASPRLYQAVAMLVDVLERCDAETLPGDVPACTDDEWDAALQFGREVLASVVAAKGAPA